LRYQKKVNRVGRVFSKENNISKRTRHDCKITLIENLETLPLYQMRQRITEEDEALSAWVQENLDNRFIWKTKSDSTSNVLIVPKLDNSFRICVDYRFLNKQTKNNNYPMLFMDYVLTKLHNIAFSPIKTGGACITT
jgi:putative transposase